MLKFIREILGGLAVLLLLMAGSPYVMPFISNMHVPIIDGMTTFIMASALRLGWILGTIFFYLPNLLFQQLPVATPLQLVYPVPFLFLIVYLLGDLHAIKKFMREQQQERIDAQKMIKSVADGRTYVDSFQRQRVIEDERKKKIEQEIKIDDQDKAKRNALFQSTLSRYVEKYHLAKRMNNLPALQKLAQINAKLLSPGFQQFMMTADWKKVEDVTARITSELDTL